MTTKTTTLPAYHTNADGSVNCTNCTKPIEYMGFDQWCHAHNLEVFCYGINSDEVACPEAPNDDDPDFYDERGWARS